MHQIMKVLPNSIVANMKNIDIEALTEIRIRLNQNLCFRLGKTEVIKEYKVLKEDIIEILRKVSNNSIYSIQKEINNGYITAPGGNRIGIVGEVVLDNGEIKNIKNISSLNVRICHEKKDCSYAVFDKIYKDNELLNTLIISPPGCGKTTILRDIIRKASNNGKNVGIVDERCEIAAASNGFCSLDVGTRTDVISNVDKSYGINLMTRSMGLDVIATDEIGSKEDILAIIKAKQSGIKVIATAHGSVAGDLPHALKNIIFDGIFDVVIYLSNEIGKIEKVVYTNQKEEVFNVY